MCIRRTAIVLVALSLLLGLPACRRKGPSLQLPALAALPADQALANMVRAHYSPITLGLAELEFEVDLSLPQLHTRMQGIGSWRKGQRPSVKVKRVEREGKTETTPKDPGVGQQIWVALQFQTEHLLDGLGSGFMSERLAHWQALKGQSKLEGDKLVLSFNEPSGDSLVTVGAGWVVSKVENRSPKKVDRWMEYQHRLENGRNLTTEARMHVKINEGANLPPGEVTLQKSQEGLTFRIDYQQTGAFVLPTQLRKTSSRGEEQLLKLHYTKVK